MDLAPEFNEFFESLNAHRVEDVVVGAYALALHGAPRYTGHLDILARPTLENATRLISGIEDFGFPVSQIAASDLVSPRRVLQMGVPPVQIHVMSSLSGVTWEDVWQGRQAIRLGHHEVCFIGREEFLADKRAAGRAKDVANIEARLGAPDDGAS